MNGKPNIVLIITDQMRGDAMGADGNSCIQTPNLDCLAAHGTRFNHAYSPTPSCLPARAILWSGSNQWHTGVLGMGPHENPCPNDFPYTLAGELTAAGYRTHLVGKGHFFPQRTAMGFQSRELDESARVETPDYKCDYRIWFEQNAPPSVTPDDHGVEWNSWLARPWHTEESLHPTAWTVKRSLHFLQNRDMAQPFFLNISFARPHSPYVPPQAYWDMYINAETPPPHVGDWASVFDQPETASDTDAWCGKMTPQQIHRARAGYFGEISFIDAQLGLFMYWFKRFQPETYDNTWFVFLSDHGDMQGDHNLWRKTYPYEGSARVPMIIVPPAAAERPARSVADEVVGHQDIMPTILEMAGLDNPPTVEGRSLLSLIDAPVENWRDYIHGEHSTCYSHQQAMQYVTDGRQKFIWLPLVGQQQFFDLESDPGECRNLIDDPAWQERIEVWRKRLIDELAARDCGWCDDGKLTCPPDKSMVSPYKNSRWQGKAT